MIILEFFFSENERERPLHVHFLNFSMMKMNVKGKPIVISHSLFLATLKKPASQLAFIQSYSILSDNSHN